jgi:hypothetical protein
MAVTEELGELCGVSDFFLEAIDVNLPRPCIFVNFIAGSPLLATLFRDEEVLSGKKAGVNRCSPGRLGRRR